MPTAQGVKKRVEALRNAIGKTLQSMTKHERMGVSFLSVMTEGRSPTAQEIKEEAKNTFANEELAQDWLNSYNIVLQDKPINLMHTEEGREMIYTVLMRIQHGVYS